MMIMIRTNALFAALCALNVAWTATANPQEVRPRAIWERVYGETGDDEATDIKERFDAAGRSAGFVLTGQSGPHPGHLFVLITDLEGRAEPLGFRVFGDTQGERGESVLQTSDGGYLATGSWTYSRAGVARHDIFVVKLDASFNLDPGCAYPCRLPRGDQKDQVAYGVTECDGGYMLAGTSDGDALLLRLLPSCAMDPSWPPKRYDAIAGDLANSICRAEDGCFFLVGEAWIPPSGQGAFLIKTDAQGVQLQNRRYPGVKGNTQFKGVHETPDGGCIAVGWTSNADGINRIYLVKTDRLGLQIAMMPVSGTVHQRGHDVDLIRDSSGNHVGYVVAGYQSFHEPDRQALVVATGLDLQPRWEWVSRAKGTWANAIEQCTDGDVVIAGRTAGSQNVGGQIYLALLRSCAPFSSESFLRGDGNTDCVVDLSDAILILGYLFQGGKLACLDAADVDEIGRAHV